MTEFQGTAATRTVAPPETDAIDSDAADSFEDRVRSLQLPKYESRRRGLRWVVLLVVTAVLGSGGWYGYRFWRQQQAGQLKVANKPVPGSAANASPSGAPATQPIAQTPAPASGLSSVNPGGAQGAAPLNNNLSSGGDAPGPPGSVALQSTGYIVAAHRILVSPKVIGTVIMLNADEGQKIKKGDVLAKIESIEYQSDYDLAAATLELSRQRLRELEQGNRPEEIAESEAQLGEATAQLSQLENDWKRKRDLRKSGVITPTEVEQAESQYQAMQQRVARQRASLKLMQIGPRVERIAAAKAEVAQREAELAKAKWRLDNCTIIAPISGTILLKNAEEGNVVDVRVMKGSYSLCEMADLSDIEVELKIQERNDIAKIHVGQQCEIRAEAYPKRTYPGVVSRIMPLADRSNAAVPVRVKINVPADEIGVYLKPDMTALVKFLN